MFLKCFSITIQLFTHYWLAVFSVVSSRRGLVHIEQGEAIQSPSSISFIFFIFLRSQKFTENRAQYSVERAIFQNDHRFSADLAQSPLPFTCFEFEYSTMDVETLVFIYPLVIHSERMHCFHCVTMTHSLRSVKLTHWLSFVRMMHKWHAVLFDE